MPLPPARDFQVDDLTDAIDELATGIYLVHRFGPSVFVDGEKVTTSSSDLNCTAVVFPAGGRQIMRLPEGQRAMQIIGIITATELLTAEAGHEPDQLRYNGEWYQVQQTDRWQQSGGFWAYVGQRVNPL